MLRATLRRAVGHGAEAPSLGLRLAPRWHGLSTVATKRTLSLGLRLAPRWHGLSTVATKRTLTLEEAMTSSHMILQTLESPTTVAQVGEAACVALGLLGLGFGQGGARRAPALATARRGGLAAACEPCLLPWRSSRRCATRRTP